jgi:hypothetical protein
VLPIKSGTKVSDGIAVGVMENTKAIYRMTAAKLPDLTPFRCSALGRVRQPWLSCGHVAQPLSTSETEVRPVQQMAKACCDCNINRVEMIFGGNSYG